MESGSVSRRPGSVEVASRSRTRWIQAGLGMVAMMAVSSPQYVWALFVGPIMKEFSVSLSVLQVTIALFSFLSCGLGPIYGFIASHLSSRQLGVLGGGLIGASWVLSGHAHSVMALYVTYGVLSGLATGFVYVAVVELMILWFPDRRGMAMGLASGSYGFGAIVTTFPIATSIKASGYQSTLTVFGYLLAVIIIAASLWMRRPRKEEVEGFVASTTVASVKADGSATTGQMLRSPVFWLLYIAMSMMATGGLMAISQLGAFAKDFGITDDVKVFGLAALPLAMTIDRIANGFTRPFFGWVSDKIGRENTMFVAFILEAMAIMLLLRFGSDPVMFVILTGVVFFGWGEIYSLFPSLQADLFGAKHAAKNFGVLLTATAVGSVLGGPVAALLYESTHSWNFVFYSVIVLDVAAALLVFFVIKPLARRRLEGCTRSVSMSHVASATKG